MGKWDIFKWEPRAGEEGLVSAGNGLWQVLPCRQRSLHKALISRDLCRADGWAPGTSDVHGRFGLVFSEMHLLQVSCSPKTLFCHCFLRGRLLQVSAAGRVVEVSEVNRQLWQQELLGGMSRESRGCLPHLGDEQCVCKGS